MSYEKLQFSHASDSSFPSCTWERTYPRNFVAAPIESAKFDHRMETIESVTALTRNASKIIATATRTRKPTLITRDGIPAAYLVDSKSYERMQTRIKILEGILQGETALREGRTLTHKQAKIKMARWLR